jgi:hypothetical protein
VCLGTRLREDLWKPEKEVSTFVKYEQSYSFCELQWNSYHGSSAACIKENWIIMADVSIRCNDSIVIEWCANTQTEVHRLPYVVLHQGNGSVANIMAHIHRISSVVDTKVTGCQIFIYQWTCNTNRIKVLNRTVLEFRGLLW